MFILLEIIIPLDNQLYGSTNEKYQKNFKKLKLRQR